MKSFESITKSVATQRRLSTTMMLVSTMLTAGVAVALADQVQPADTPTVDSLKALTVRWFAQMQEGKLDRTEYTAAYAAEITDEAVRKMSSALNRYGASPIGVEIVQTRRTNDQTFYAVKYIFPRGDATSLLFGFDAGARSPASALRAWQEIESLACEARRQTLCDPKSDITRGNQP